MSSEAKLPKLIVVMAFDRDEEGELQTVFGPADQQIIEACVQNSHAGLVGSSTLFCSNRLQ